MKKKSTTTYIVMDLSDKLEKLSNFLGYLVHCGLVFYPRIILH